MEAFEAVQRRGQSGGARLSACLFRCRNWFSRKQLCSRTTRASCRILPAWSACPSLPCRAMPDSCLQSKPPGYAEERGAAYGPGERTRKLDNNTEICQVCFILALPFECSRIALAPHPVLAAGPFYFSSVSQRTIVRVTNGLASRCTKWPAPGTVTRVRSLSSHFQVSLSAPGSRYWSPSP